MRLSIKFAIGIFSLVLVPVVWIQGWKAYRYLKLDSFVKAGPGNQVVADSLMRGFTPEWDISRVITRKGAVELIPLRVQRIKTRNGNMRGVGSCIFQEQYSQYIHRRIIERVDFYGSYLCPVELDSASGGLMVEIVKDDREWSLADIRFHKKKG